MIHPTAEIEPGAYVHPTATIWRWTHVRTGASIGEGVSIGSHCYIGENVQVPLGCRIQNGVHLHCGIYLGKYVFIGPQAVFVNDLYPRAQKRSWFIPTCTTIREGASIGANATILGGITLGEYCMVGAGAVVTKDVTPYTIVAGNPAVVIGRCNQEGQPCDTEP